MTNSQPGASCFDSNASINRQLLQLQKKKKKILPTVANQLLMKGNRPPQGANVCEQSALILFLNPNLSTDAYI